VCVGAAGFVSFSEYQGDMRGKEKKKIYAKF
jgi:hypothetical protein